MIPARVLVVGGSGYFGRLLVDELCRFTACDVIIGARNQSKVTKTIESSSFKERLSARQVDLRNASSIDAAIADVQIAICAAGPFQSLPLTFAQKCIERKVPYIDLADAREYVRSIRELPTVKTACAAVCTGWSAVPALSGPLTAIAAEGIEHLDRIHTQIAPGNKAPRGQSTVASLLESVGKKHRLWRDGKWTSTHGWSQPCGFSFPPPVGNRIGRLVDVADYDIFPSRFNAQTVEFRVSSELEFLNKGVDVLSSLVSSGVIRSLTPLTPIFQSSMALFGNLGHDWGAIGVECTGRKSNETVHRQACIVAANLGHWIPIMPATIMAAKILASGDDYIGLQDPVSWITSEELRLECEKRNYKLIVE